MEGAVPPARAILAIDGTLVDTDYAASASELAGGRLRPRGAGSSGFGE